MPGHTVTTKQADLHVRVLVDGQQVADTHHPVLLDETGLPTRYYLPPSDVRTDLLTATTFSTHCPFKGDASYWSLDLDGTVHDGIVWGYKEPLPAAAEIAGMMCFYPDRSELVVGDD